jgi:hypothetical protein
MSKILSLKSNLNKFKTEILESLEKVNNLLKLYHHIINIHSKFCHWEDINNLVLVWWGHVYSKKCYVLTVLPNAHSHSLTIRFWMDYHWILDSMMIFTATSESICSISHIFFFSFFLFFQGKITLSQGSLIGYIN